MTTKFQLPLGLSKIIDNNSDATLRTIKKRLREAGFSTYEIPNTSDNVCISPAKLKSLRTCTSIKEVKQVLCTWIAQLAGPEMTNSSEPIILTENIKSVFCVEHLRLGDIIFHKTLGHPALIIKTSYDKNKELRLLYVTFLSSSYKEHSLEITTRFVKPTYATPTVAILVEDSSLIKEYKHSITRTETLRVKNWIKSQITL